MNPANLLTVANYAKLHNVNRIRIYQLISDNKIIPIVINEVIFIDREEYPKLPVRHYMKYRARKIQIK